MTTKRHADKLVAIAKEQGFNNLEDAQRWYNKEYTVSNINN